MRRPTRRKSKKRARGTSPALELFGTPALIEGEDPSAFDDFLAAIRAAVRPHDILEEMLVRDIADIDWEIRRYRRLKANIMDVMKADALSSMDDLRKEVRSYFSELGDEEFEKLLDDWVHHDTSKKVNATFASAGLTMDAVMAVTLLENLDAIARINQMIALAEARRNGTTRELERHRVISGGAVCRAIEHTQGCQLQTINTQPAEEMSVP